MTNRTNKTTDFGKILKELRGEQGLTQVQLAKAIGVSQGTIYFWENGINEPTSFYVVALADFFNVSTDELLGHSSEYCAVHDASTAEAETAEIVRLYSALPNDKKKTALALLKALREN